jgi:hypothetical protein
VKPLDFMIIGAQKAGTTALSHFLSQHPDVVMAKGKEVHLFDAQDYSADWSQDKINQRYAAHFDGANPAALWGEATPIYLYRSEIIPELKRYNPALKLIVILRDPAERAISHYEMEKARSNEDLPLWKALWCESARLKQEGEQLGHAHRCHSYVDRGKYATQINCVRQYFSDEQILILENDALKNQHDDTLKKVYEFLAVDAGHDVPGERVFSGDYRNKYSSLYYSLIKMLLRWRFRSANVKLKMLLMDMGISPSWRWLK